MALRYGLAGSLLTALLPLVSDLSRELPEGERYRRLLEAMRADWVSANCAGDIRV
mgnify:CR=1 FL=1